MKDSVRLLLFGLVCGLVWMHWLPEPCLAGRNDLPLTAVDVVRKMKPSSGSKQVRTQGVVTYVDADSRTLFIQDQSGGIQVELQEENRALAPGQWVEAQGIGAAGSISPVISGAQVSVLGKRPIPSAPLTRLSRLNIDTDHSRWLRFGGLVVQNVYEEGPYTVLDAYEREQRLQIRINRYSIDSAGSLIDAEIDVHGVFTITTDSAGKPTGMILWVPSGSAVSIVSTPQFAPGQLPVTSISALEKIWKTNPPQHRVRIQGTLMSGDKEDILLVQDKSGIIEAAPLFSRPIAQGDEVDLTGFADLSSHSPRLINATYLRIKAIAIESKQEPGLPTLTKIGQIRQLDPKEAGRGYPVSIQGVITYHNPGLSMTFIQDNRQAIYIQSLDPLLSLMEGTRYQVDGFSAPGDFAPIIVKPKFRILGKAPMPPATAVTLSQLSTGQYDCLRVQARGIVREVRQVGNRWRIELSGDGRNIEVWTPYLSNSAQALSLQDSRVMVTGICSIQISSWGTITGFRINVPSISEIKVEKQGETDLFAVPLRPIRDLFRYSSRDQSEHRVRIEGILLHQQPGKALYIRDDTASICIPVSRVMPVSSNDRITVSGYPASGEYAPTLEHALVKRIGPGAPPEAIPLPPGRTGLTSSSHGTLVKIRAKLADQWLGAQGQSYFLQDLKDVQKSFEAFLEMPPGGAAAPRLNNGSELELTGIYLFRKGGTKRSRFELLLRTPEDIRLIKAAPWWTLKHFYWVFGILICLIIFGSVWAGMLKTQVNRQTSIIQQRLEAEAALKKKYQGLFEASHDIVFSCGADGRLTAINPSGSRTLGYSNEELSTLDPKQLIASSSLSKVIDWIDRKSKGIPCSNLECELIAKNGRQILVEVNSQIFQSEGKITGAQGIARDITERKQAEEALRQGQKLEAIGRLAGGIAHDFNNILSAILGFAELSTDELPDRHPVRPNLEQIVKAGKRARDLVQQILTFSRKLEQERRPIYLQTIVEEALILLKATLPATVEIRRNIRPDCNPVLADPTQMHQIILNLTTNAAHAIAGHEGFINIGLEQIALNTNSLELSPGQYLRLSVTDTGPGIAPEIQKRIFEPYFTTKSVGQGSGLGLAVVHGIVKSHNGGISVTNKPGQGACFEVYLPCCNEKVKKAPTPTPEVAKGKGRILLVDDEEAIVSLAARILQKLGYEVTGETRSSTALEKFKDNPELFDLIITDQTMPQLTGQALAQEIWKIRPQMPVIISTGFSEQVTPDKIAGSGFQALLTKPYTASELGEAVKKSLA